jgi:hypothetical protein
MTLNRRHVLRSLPLPALALVLALLSGTPAFTQAAPAYRVGDAVSIQWSASWWGGRILEVADGRYKVRYDGYDASWDEWVTPARLRPVTPTAPAAPALPTRPPAPPAQPARPSAPPAARAPARALDGTWQYQSWISSSPEGRREMMNRDVFYWLTIRPNGTWSLSNTTRWSPNSPEFIGGGSYTLQRGTLVLTQSGTPQRTYGRYSVQQSADGTVTLRDLDTGDVIVLRRGRG